MVKDAEVPVAYKQNLDKAGKLLIDEGYSIAIAESVTAGNIQAAFSLAENTTRFFQGGITLYNIGQKCRHLNIDPIHAEHCNCVSQKVSDEMAANICDLFCTGYGIAIIGYASPVPEKNFERLFAYVSIARNKKVVLSKKIFAENTSPREVQMFYTERVIEMLLEVLER